VKLDDKGVTFRVESHKTCCRFDCQDVGAYSRHVPYDRIQDVQVREPAGAVCCCVPRVLYTVGLQTAGSGGAPEIILVGLKNPALFRNIVINAKEEGGLRARKQAAALVGPAVEEKTVISSIASMPTKGLLHKNIELLEKQVTLLNNSVVCINEQIVLLKKIANGQEMR